MNKKIWIYTIYILFLVTVLSLFLLVAQKEERLLIIACDVGQGDAILIQKKSVQIMVDGGPGDKATDCLARHMPFFDRKIELVVLTHPQIDHYEGLISVFESYNVDTFLHTGLDIDSESYSLLESLVVSQKSKIIEARSGNRLSLGELKINIVNPMEDMFDGQESTKDPNDYSVVFYLEYLDFDGLFTGDIGPSVSDRLSINSFDIDYLKVPHHGSKNGLSQKLLESLDPEISIISAGTKNRYGHPHPEILKMLEENNSKIFKTGEIGDLIVATDGRTYNIKNVNQK